MFKTRAFIVLGLALLTISTGCKFPSIQEYEIKLRNRYWAAKAWRQVRGSYREQGAGHPILDDFGRGWRDGYYAVAFGGSGEIPLFPPTRYWGSHHQNPTGRDEIQSWFAGWQEGVAAAKADGVGYWMEIPMSGGEEAAVERQRAARDRGTVERVPAGEPTEMAPEPIEELPPTRTTSAASKSWFSRLRTF